MIRGLTASVLTFGGSTTLAVTAGVAFGPPRGRSIWETTLEKLSPIAPAIAAARRGSESVTVTVMIVELAAEATATSSATTVVVSGSPSFSTTGARTRSETISSV